MGPPARARGGGWGKKFPGPVPRDPGPVSARYDRRPSGDVMSRVVVVLAAALVFAGALVWWGWAGSGDAPDVRAVAREAPAVEPVDLEAPTLVADEPDVEPVRVAPAELEDPPPAAPEPAAVEQPRPRAELDPGPTGTVSVVVEGPGGAPVARAEVWAQGSTPYDRAAIRIRGRARTDDRGRAELTDVRLGEVVVVASAEALAEGVSEPFQLTSERRDAEARVVLTRGGRVEGRLTDVEGAPAAGVRLSIHHTRHSVLRTTDAATDGSFAFEHLPAGGYTLWTRAEGDERLRVPQQSLKLEVREGETTVASFADQGATHVLLSGRVLCDDEPCAGSYVSIGRSDPSQGSVFLRAETDAGGRFSVALGEPGSYRIQVVRHSAGGGFRGSIAFAVEIPPVSAFEVELAFWTGSVTGRVLDPAGRPASGAEVRLFGREGTTASYSATTGEDGRYEVVGAATGTYRVVAQGASTALRIGADDDPSTARVEVVAGATATVLDLWLPVTTSIEGRVTNAVGEPVAAAHVHVSGGPTTHRLFDVRSDASGAFVLHDVEPGDYWLRASWHEATSPWTSINAAGRVPARVDLALEPGARVELRVPGGAQPAGRVLVSGTDDLGRSCGYVALETGAGALGPLPPGTYHLRAHRGSQEVLAEETVTLAAGEQRTLTLQLKE